MLDRQGQSDGGGWTFAACSGRVDPARHGRAQRSSPGVDGRLTPSGPRKDPAASRLLRPRAAALGSASWSALSAEGWPVRVLAVGGAFAQRNRASRLSSSGTALAAPTASFSLGRRGAELVATAAAAQRRSMRAVGSGSSCQRISAALCCTARVALSAAAEIVRTHSAAQRCRGCQIPVLWISLWSSETAPQRCQLLSLAARVPTPDSSSAAGIAQ